MNILNKMNIFSEKVKIPTLKLSSGYKIPVLAFGTSRYGGQSAQLYSALKYGLQIGYRHIDGAYIYFTDSPIYRAISECLAEGLVNRDDIFITHKLWLTFHTREMARIGLQTTLKNLGIEYLDMLMIHYPMGLKPNPGSNAFPCDDEGNLEFSKVNFLDTYSAMEEMVDEGLIKSIGVCNFNLSQLEHLLTNCRIKPAMVQVECNPYLQNDKLIDFCQNNGITVCAYGVFGAYDLALLRETSPILLDDPILNQIGKKYNKTVAQVCIKWCLQRNLVVVNKTLLPEKVLENAQVFDFELTKEDMCEIKKLNKNYRIFNAIKLKDHPFYPFNETF